MRDQLLYGGIGLVGDHRGARARGSQRAKQFRYAVVGKSAVGAVLGVVRAEIVKHAVGQRKGRVFWHGALDQQPDAVADKAAHFLCTARRQTVFCERTVGAGC